jgi:hypothetical protein
MHVPFPVAIRSSLCREIVTAGWLRALIDALLIRRK